jgi:hypothetical protein
MRRTSRGKATDRSYWVQRSSSASVSIADDVLALVNSLTPGMQLKYNKHYIGLTRYGIADNFVQVRPRRSHAVLEIRLAGCRGPCRATHG